MSLEFQDLESFKYYKERLKKVLRSSGNEVNYSVITFKFSGESTSRDILLVGKNINDIIEEIGVVYKGKIVPKTIDQGVIKAGEAVSKRGTLTQAMIESWGVDAELRIKRWNVSEKVPGTDFTGLQALSLAAEFEKSSEQCEHPELKKLLVSRLVDLREQINNGTPSNVRDTLSLIRMYAGDLKRAQDLEKKLEPFTKIIKHEGVPKTAITLYESAKKLFQEGKFQSFEEACVQLGKELPLVGNRFAKLDPKLNKISVESNTQALQKSDNKIASAYRLVKTNMESSIGMVLGRPNDPETSEATALKGLIKNTMKLDLHKLLVGFEKAHSNKDLRLKLAQKIIEVVQKYMDAMDSVPNLTGGGMLASKYYALLRHIHSQMSDVMMQA